jgi:acetyl-CoA carboxylase biotin carboxyl carrier protein
MKMSTEILAPMPGTIFQVHVKAGDDVVEGQELLVLEAMKMENPIVSTTAGKVKQVDVKVDDKVATKQLLLVIE